MQPGVICVICVISHSKLLDCSDRSFDSVSIGAFPSLELLSPAIQRPALTSRLRPDAAERAPAWPAARTPPAAHTSLRCSAPERLPCRSSARSTMTSFRRRPPPSVLRPPSSASCSFCIFVARPYAARTTGMHSLGRGGEPSAEFEAETPPATTSLRPRIATARPAYALHPPNRGRPQSASANAKTTSADQTASFHRLEMISFDSKNRDSSPSPRSSESGERTLLSTDDAAKPPGRQSQPCAAARSAWVSVLRPGSDDGFGRFTSLSPPGAK